MVTRNGELWIVQNIVRICSLWSNIVSWERSHSTAQTNTRGQFVIQNYRLLFLLPPLQKLQKLTTPKIHPASTLAKTEERTTRRSETTSLTMSAVKGGHHTVGKVNPPLARICHMSPRLRATICPLGTRCGSVWLRIQGLRFLDWNECDVGSAARASRRKTALSVNSACKYCSWFHESLRNCIKVHLPNVYYITWVDSQ